MCSSPKSSGNPKPKKPPARGVYSNLGTKGRSRFTAIANAADERRQTNRKMAHTRKQMNPSFSANNFSAKNRPQTIATPFTWLLKPYTLSNFLRWFTQPFSG